MTMAAYAARRTLFYVLLFFVVSFLIFFTIHALIDPDTFNNYGLLRSDRHTLPIDPPIVVQYLRWLGDFFTGNWGTTHMQIV